jgi:hypothetical protein
MASMNTTLSPLRDPRAARPLPGSVPAHEMAAELELAELFPDRRRAADEALADLFPALRLRMRTPAWRG